MTRPELKLASPMQRLDLMSREDYASYYVEQHTKNASGLPGNYRYIGSPAICGVDGGDPPFDGYAEMYYDDLAAVKAAYTSDAWEAARRDHPSIVAGRVMFMVEEHELLAPPPIGSGAVKYVALLTRRDIMSRQDFAAYWLEKHVPLALETPGLRGYRASVGVCSASGDSILRDEPDAPQFDGVVEMWFDSVETFQESFRDPHWDELRTDYYQRFAMGRIQALVREHLVFDLRAGGKA
jgi:uncharacterized protein (TIGR02118 family)